MVSDLEATGCAVQTFLLTQIFGCCGAIVLIKVEECSGAAVAGCSARDMPMLVDLALFVSRRSSNESAHVQQNGPRLRAKRFAWVENRLGVHAR